MKMNGSNREDTLIGTASGDVIKALGGNDLIATAGGMDKILAGSGNDMITGFSYKLSSAGTDDGGTGTGGIGIGRAAGKSIVVDGGAGSHDIMLVELTAARGTSQVDSFKQGLTIRNVEEFIYNFSSVSAGQKILGSNNIRSLETIVVGSGTADIDTRGGDDFVYTADGDDIIRTGNGSDFIHAGNGRNVVTSGSGVDYFHFQLTGVEQYTEITDFEEGVDKILVSIDVGQVNLYFGTDYESRLPDRTYGDRYIGVGPSLNAYVSYNNGREFDPATFGSENPVLSFDDWAYYEQSTGSIFIINYAEDPADTQRVLVAKVKEGTDIDMSDFAFLMM